MNPTQSRSYDILWMSLAILPLIALSCLFPIIPQDYWWLLRVGQETIRQAAVPTIETMSWTSAGQPIVYEPWLAGVFFWWAHAWGGASLTFLVRALLIGLTYGLIWSAARNSAGPRLATILVVILGFASSNNWQMRAQLFAYPLFAFCLLALLKWQSGNNRWLWGIPLATLLWVNVHGSYILVFLLAGAALVFGKESRRALAITLALMFAATLVNPQGIRLWGHVAFMLTTPSNQAYSLEWQPPVNAGWQMNIFFAWTLLFAPLAAFSSRKLSPLEWVWFLGFGWLAFSGLRYVIWFLFILTVLTARPLAELTRHKLDSPVKISSPAFNIALACLFIPLSLLYLPGLRDRWWPEAPSPYSMDLTPFGAETWLKEHPNIPGPLWNDYIFGSYLLFALPSRPISIDSRFFPFPARQMQEYQEISRGSTAWESAFDRDGINLLLLSPERQPKLIDQVEASSKWCEQYRDEIAVIFSRCEPVQ
ncbi:MAG: hypothetical protein ACM3XO_23140 [Bacteroidota bacterium]